MTNQEIVQKMMACKSNKIARNSTVVAAILYLIVGLITIWLGCAARQVGVVNDDSVFAFFELMKESLPKHLFPFVILVVVAITMSTADAYLFTASFIASNNVFSSIIGRNAAKLYYFMQFNNFMIVILALSLSLAINKLYEVMIFSAIIRFATSVIPIFFAISRFTVFPICAWLSSICATTAAITSFLYIDNIVDAFYLAIILSLFSSIFGFLFGYLVRYIRCITLVKKGL